jgi:hypothetical protein
LWDCKRETTLGLKPGPVERWVLGKFRFEDETRKGKDRKEN